MSAKSKNRESFIRMKSESPKYKDVLRQKYQQRLRQNRWNIFNNNRNIPEDAEIHNTLTNIIKEDLKSLTASSTDNPELNRNLDHFDEIEDELLHERLKWLTNEYDKILDDEDQLADLLDEMNHVICPICQKSTLSKECTSCDSFATCVCGVRISTSLQLPQIKENVMQRVNTHNLNCTSDPEFALIKEHDENHIYLICYTCSSFTLLL